VTLALLFSGLIVCELLFGSWFFGGGLGFVHVPRDLVLQHDVSKFRPGGGAVRYSRDRWGLSGSHGEPSELNVLTIGGSTTDELYSDDTETWSTRLQERFTRADIPAVVGNAGINGHSTVGHIYSMKAWLSRVPQLKPKVILFYLGINDVALPAQARHDAIVAVGAWPRIGRYIINNSALVRLIRIVRGSIRAKNLRVAYHTVSAPPCAAGQLSKN
jgi:lysophospholipase L1-like esterase